MAVAYAGPTLLTIPCELRNVIYALVFDLNTFGGHHLPQPALNVASDGKPSEPLSRRLDLLRTCRQIHQEAGLLALSLTPFHVAGDCSYPDLFDLRSRPLSVAKIGAIRQLTLTARISHLRALNEDWAGKPFGHPSLRLEKLVIVPLRPNAVLSCWGEVADLSQCHTLAYILSETIKGLKNVKTLEVKNDGCFGQDIWRLVYKSLVIRMWRWGGCYCGVRFECSPDSDDTTTRAAETSGFWFRLHMQNFWPSDVESDFRRYGLECGDEICRLAGESGVPVANHAIADVDHT